MKTKLQVAPKLIPAGLLVTVPTPAPVVVTVRVNVFGGAVKLAVTVWSTLIVTVHEPVPLHAPLQPVNVEPPMEAADRVTVLPLAKSAAHVVPQEIPLGLLVTVPVPVPDLLTVNRSVLGMAVNVADTLALPVTVQAPLPEQSPPQLINDEPAAAAAFKATEVPVSN